MRLYIGSTNNPYRRFTEHLLGRAASTRISKPVALLDLQGYATQREGYAAEEKLQGLYKNHGYATMLTLLSEAQHCSHVSLPYVLRWANTAYQRPGLLKNWRELL